MLRHFVALSLALLLGRSAADGVARGYPRQGTAHWEVASAPTQPAANLGDARAHFALKATQRVASPVVPPGDDCSRGQPQLHALHAEHLRAATRQRDAELAARAWALSGARALAFPYDANAPPRA